MTVACAVCGRTVEPDRDHVVIEVTKRRIQDRDKPLEFYMHDHCARNTIGSWANP